jgi:predicted MFS family arabinose efflux permease
MTADRPETRLATRLSFLVAGFGIACWAPLVPFARQRLGVDDGALGLLLLCLGVGSVAAMLLTGSLCVRCGSRPVIAASGLGMAFVLPLLAVAGTPAGLGLALFVFGACLGSLDVAMNVHAVDVERASGRPLMSGFHALFSVGGFAGSALMTCLLTAGAGLLGSTLACSALMLAALACAWPRLLASSGSGESVLFALPRGIVLLLAALAAVTFLAEGALLDWIARYITQAGLVSAARGGIGYMVFSVAMTAGRLGGDAVAARTGDRAILFWGGLLEAAGFVLLLTAPRLPAALAGFLLIGLGASNLVPILFRRAGAQGVMPRALAVAAITTTGYAGILLGPAGIGLVARTAGLSGALWIVAALAGTVTLGARLVAPEPSAEG